MGVAFGKTAGCARGSDCHKLPSGVQRAPHFAQAHGEENASTGKGGNKRRLTRILLRHPVVAKLGAERLDGNAEQPGSLALVPVQAFEGLEDMLPLHIL